MTPPIFYWFKHVYFALNYGQCICTYSFRACVALARQVLEDVFLFPKIYTLVGLYQSYNAMLSTFQMPLIWLKVTWFLKKTKKNLRNTLFLRLCWFLVIKKKMILVWILSPIRILILHHYLIWHHVVASTNNQNQSELHYCSYIIIRCTFYHFMYLCMSWCSVTLLWKSIKM